MSKTGLGAAFQGSGAFRRSLVAVALALLVGFAAGVAAGPSETVGQEREQEVLAAVQRFFDGLASNSPEVLGREMVFEGQLVRLLETDGETSHDIVRYADYLSGFGSSDVQLLERMWDPQVLVHGPLAIVWTPYDFHNDGVFSHCGIDAFTMIETSEGWKTVGVAFTVQREDCEPSPLGPPRR